MLTASSPCNSAAEGRAAGVDRELRERVRAEPPHEDRRQRHARRGARGGEPALPAAARRAPPGSPREERRRPRRRRGSKRSQHVVARWSRRSARLRGLRRGRRDRRRRSRCDLGFRGLHGRRPCGLFDARDRDRRGLGDRHCDRLGRRRRGRRGFRVRRGRRARLGRSGRRPGLDRRRAIAACEARAHQDHEGGRCDPRGEDRAAPAEKRAAEHGGVGTRVFSFGSLASSAGPRPRRVPNEGAEARSRRVTSSTLGGITTGASAGSVTTGASAGSVSAGGRTELLARTGAECSIARGDALARRAPCARAIRPRRRSGPAWPGAAPLRARWPSPRRSQSVWPARSPGPSPRSRRAPARAPRGNGSAARSPRGRFAARTAGRRALPTR